MVSPSCTVARGLGRGWGVGSDTALGADRGTQGPSLTGWRASGLQAAGLGKGSGAGGVAEAFPVWGKEQGLSPLALAGVG